MARVVFRDFDEFADSLSGVTGRYIPTARSTESWWIEAVRVNRLVLQRVQVGGAATFAGDGTQGSVSLGIALADATAIRIDGHALSDNSFIVLRHDQPLTSSAAKLTRWIGVTLPVDVAGLTAQWAVLALSSPRAQAELRMLEHVRSLVSRICIDDETVNVVDPIAAVAAEEEVLSALSKLLWASTSAHDRHVGRPQLSRNRVIARCLELIHDSGSQPLFISDLCRVTQVSERTLRNIFQEYFGVGPMRLLKVRQLREVRSALLAADPLEQTVMRIAARFGIWDFSLFARNYRALYGEAPSQTLRGPHSSWASDAPMTPTWISYAARRFSHQLAQPLAVPVSAAE